MLDTEELVVDRGWIMHNVQAKCLFFFLFTEAHYALPLVCANTRAIGLY